MLGQIGAQVGALGNLLKTMTEDIALGKNRDRINSKGDMMSLLLSTKDVADCGIDLVEANALVKKIASAAACSRAELWTQLTQTNILTPHQPFALHELCFNKIYNDEDKPRVCWEPTRKDTNVRLMMKQVGCKSVAEFHSWSVKNREEFWKRTMENMCLKFDSGVPKQIFEMKDGVEKVTYCKGTKMNIVDSCFQSHPNACAVVYQIEGEEEIRRWSFRELEALTNRVANGLVKAGFKKGDTIGMCMTMTAESVAIYLGIVRAGCAVVSIADSFSPGEIQTRMEIAKSKAMFTQDWIYRGGKRHPLFDRVVSAGVDRCIILPGNFDTVDGIELRKGDLTWAKFLDGASDKFKSVSMDISENSNILFSSGTTGTPKAIPWSHSSPIKAAMDGYLHMNINSKDVVSWPTNIGWMMGPWLIYASLLNGASIALFCGSPGGVDFCRFIQDAKATFLGVVPSLVKAWQASNATENLDWTKVERFSSTGEASSPMSMLWLMSRAGYSPVVEYCGGTEIAGGFVCGSMDMPQSPSCFSTPAFGLDFTILDEDQKETEKEGELALIAPSLGMSVTLLNRDHTDAYFTGMPKRDGVTLRRHGDHFERMEDGFWRALGRVDDTMNLGGIKVSSVELERSCNIVEGVAETAAIAISPKGGGPSLLVVYTVLSAGSNLTEAELKVKFQQSIKTHLNPLFRVSSAVVINTLPRTASNKVMRRTLRDMYCKAQGVERVSSSGSMGNVSGLVMSSSRENLAEEATQEAKE